MQRRWNLSSRLCCPDTPPLQEEVELQTSGLLWRMARTGHAEIPGKEWDIL
jgi:hypothetical protein